MNTGFDFRIVTRRIRLLEYRWQNSDLICRFDNVDLDDFDNRKSESNNGILAEKFLVLHLQYLIVENPNG